MMQQIKKFKEFALEMCVGLLVGALGMLQLLYKVPIPGLSGLASPELMDKVGAAFVTIGGTVLLSGIFRFAISARLEHAENRIVAAVEGAVRDFCTTISSLQPRGLNPRPNDDYAGFRYLYWRTKDELGQPIWVSFSKIAWRTRALPVFDSHATLEDIRSTLRYFLAMVQLHNCLVVSATRVNADDTPLGEMAGVYVFAIPVAANNRLCGFVRHQNMASRQSLSPCILSMEEIGDRSELDRIWVRSAGSVHVDRNFPGDDLSMPTLAAE
jgi:hypothetical protein